MVVVLFVGPGVLGAAFTMSSAPLSSAVLKHCNVGELPGFPAYDPVNGYIYVPNDYALGVASDNITVVKAPCTLVATIHLPYSDAAPLYAAYDPQNNYVYVTDWHLNQVYVLSGTSLLTTVNRGWFNEPAGITYDPAGAGMLVANYGSDNVTLISPGLFDGLDLLGSPWSFSSSPQQIAVDPVLDSIDVTFPLNNEFATASPNSPYVPTTTPIAYANWSDGAGSAPGQIAYDPAISSMFVANYGTSSLTTFLSMDSYFGPGVNVGADPQGLCYSAVHQYMYVMNSGSNSVWEISPSLSVAKKVSLGSSTSDVEPLGCAYDAATNQMYVTGFLSGELYVLA